MSYQVIARKYRPGTFSAVSGQEHVTRTLSNALKSQRIAHVYLFCGLRGVGKTSVARIFAKALNCLSPDGIEPCLECENCRDITQGRSLAVLEVDGASNNSVDNVRDLTESVRSSAPPGYRYKLYIIDEVHMLSTAAFNALLKTLEEPPPHTVFILATTESHKIPDTVLSRCQRFDFRGLQISEIESSLRKILETEHVPAEDDALRLIARLAEGSMRDAQSLLERVLAYSPERVSSQAVEEALGAVTGEDIFRLSESVFHRDTAVALKTVNEIFRKGIDPGILLRHFVAHWRDILLISFSSGSEIGELGIGKEQLSRLKNILTDRSAEDIQDIVQIARTGAERALQSSFPQYAFESLIVRLCTRQPVRDLSDTLQKVREALAKSNGSSAVSSGTEEGSRGRSGAGNSTEGKMLASSTNEVLVDPIENEFDFASFVRSLQGKASPIFLEHLKRLKVVRFTGTTLSVQGPDLTVKYLSTEDCKRTVVEKLEEFSGRKSWKLEILSTESKKGVAKGSLLDQELEQKRNVLQEKRTSLESHPAVQSLRKAFPGSTIEKLRVKQAGSGESS